MLDNLAEDDETFAVTIASRGSSLTDNGVTIAVATGTIRGNDPLRVDFGGPRAVAVAAASASGVPYTLTLTGGTTDAGNDITVETQDPRRRQLAYRATRWDLLRTRLGSPMCADATLPYCLADSAENIAHASSRDSSSLF